MPVSCDILLASKSNLESEREKERERVFQQDDLFSINWSVVSSPLATLWRMDLMIFVADNRRFKRCLTFPSFVRLGGLSVGR